MMGGSESSFTRRRSFLTVSTILFVISALMMLVARSESEAFSKPRMVIDNISAPIINVINMPIRGAERLIGNMSARSKVYEENKRLRVEIARLKNVEVRVEALNAKVNRFEEILKTDIVDDIPAIKIPARTVAETNGPFVRSALLNVGRNDGIARGHPVMTIDGLYGHIIRVGSKSSRALLLTDLNSRIAVKSRRSGARAILTGNNSNVPTLSFIGPEADWKAGDVVITSGDEGVLPAGLPIGEASAGETERKFNVTLYSAKQAVDWIWVYPFTPVEAPDDDEIDGEQSSAAEPGAAQGDTPESGGGSTGAPAQDNNR